MPDESEVRGLLALLELTAARFPARPGPDGHPVLLADQDRRRWDLAAVRRGCAALVRAGRVGRGLGAYGLQAAIAEYHAVAPSVHDTDSERIVVLYEALGRLAPSPVVELNRAVALSMAQLHQLPHPHPRDRRHPPLPATHQPERDQTAPPNQADLRRTTKLCRRG